MALVVSEKIDIMDEELVKEANEMLDILGVRNQQLMGLSTPEEAYFDILLWLLGGGEKPEID